MVNEDVLTDAPVTTLETSRHEAEALGALAFFGDKYGERVRVVRAGPHSVELCGGTHVGALGMVGPITIVSESSIGSGTRRIEAATGSLALARLNAREGLLSEAAALLKTEPEQVPAALERLLERQRAAERSLEEAERRSLASEAASLVAQAAQGVVVVRRDGLAADLVRALAQQACRSGGLAAVVVGGSPDGERATLTACVEDAGAARATASELVALAGPLIGGGGGGSPALATAGGKDPSGLDRALDEVRRVLAGQ
jgi:alanyl-tRNA synthetase